MVSWRLLSSGEWRVASGGKDRSGFLVFSRHSPLALASHLRQGMSLKKLPNDIIGDQAIGRPARQPRVELAATAGPVVAEAADDAGRQLRSFAPAERRGCGRRPPRARRAAPADSRGRRPSGAASDPRRPRDGAAFPRRPDLAAVQREQAGRRRRRGTASASAAPAAARSASSGRPPAPRRRNAATAPPPAGRPCRRRWKSR